MYIHKEAAYNPKHRVKSLPELGTVTYTGQSFMTVISDCPEPPCSWTMRNSTLTRRSSHNMGQRYSANLRVSLTGGSRGPLTDPLHPTVLWRLRECYIPIALLSMYFRKGRWRNFRSSWCAAEYGNLVAAKTTLESGSEIASPHPMPHPMSHPPAIFILLHTNKALTLLP